MNLVGALLLKAGILEKDTGTLLFRVINHLLKHELNVRFKVLHETSEQRSVRHFGKTTKIPKFLAKIKKKNEQGISENRKNLLEDKSRKKAGQWIKAFPSQMLIKGVGKDRGDQLCHIKMLIQRWKKEGTSSIDMS